MLFVSARAQGKARGVVGAPSPCHAAAAPSKGAARKSLITRTLERCKAGLNRIGGGAGSRRPPPAVAGCFPVYVGAERARFVVRADCAAHPLFRRLLDDAEREFGHAARGPLALPCDVDAFLDVLWHMEHGGAGDEEDGDETAAAAAAMSASPICGLQSFSKGRAAGYRMVNPRSSPVLARRRSVDQGAAILQSNRQLLL